MAECETVKTLKRMLYYTHTHAHTDTHRHTHACTHTEIHTHTVIHTDRQTVTQ